MFTFVRTCLYWSEHVYICSSMFIMIWTGSYYLNMFVLIRTSSNWFFLVRSCSYWSEHVHIGLNVLLLILKCSYCFKYFQSCSYLFEHVCIDPRKFKLVHISSETFILIRICPSMSLIVEICVIIEGKPRTCSSKLKLVWNMFKQYYDDYFEKQFCLVKLTIAVLTST